MIIYTYHIYDKATKRKKNLNLCNYLRKFVFLGLCENTGIWIGFWNIYFILIMHVCVWVCRSPQLSEASDPLGLELQVAVSPLTWVLGTDPVRFRNRICLIHPSGPRTLKLETNKPKPKQNKNSSQGTLQDTRVWDPRGSLWYRSGYPKVALLLLPGDQWNEDLVTQGPEGAAGEERCGEDPGSCSPDSSLLTTGLDC